jgi:predicted dehydrogenase
MINFGLIGCGYWGKNIARNIFENKDSSLSFVSDLDESNLVFVNQNFPNTKTTQVFQDILDDSTIDIVGIFTPPKTHYELIIKALENDKHILVTKPLCLSLEQAKKIKDISEEKQLKVFLDDTFLFSGPVRFLKKYFQAGSFGDLIFIQSSRINLGLIQNDCNVIWDLGPHDIGILNHILGLEPMKVRATGFNPYEDIYNFECHSNCDLVYENNLFASITLSWLSSIKTRRMIFGGTNETVIYDHLDNENQIKIFKQSILPSEVDSSIQFNYSIGETFLPKIDSAEPLKTEIEEVVHSIKTNDKFVADVDHAIGTIKVIESLQLSLNSNGEFVNL